MRLIGLLAATLLPALASTLALGANVLQLDLNARDLEIATTRQVTALRKEKLYVYPDYSADQRKKILLARYAEMAEGKRLDQAISEKNEANIAKYREKLAKTIDGVKAAMGKGATAEDLDEHLSRLEESGDLNIDTLVISSHHTTNNFWGVYTYDTQLGMRVDFLFDDFIRIIKNHPLIEASLRSVIIMACYSGSREQALRWKLHLPKVELVLGFEEASADGDLPQSYDFLRDGVINRDTLRTPKSPEEALRGIKSLHYAGYGMAAGVLGSYYASIRDNSALLLTDAALNCQAGKVRIKEKVDVYQKYFSGEREPIGADLRSFYDLVQKYSHCSLKDDSQLPLISKIIALIHYREVFQQFTRAFGDDIAAVNGALDRLKAHPAFKLQWTDLVSKGQFLGRRTLVEKIESVDDFVRTPSPEGVDPATREQDVQLVLDFLSWARKIPYNLECIPAAWITRESPSPHKPPADCSGTNGFDLDPADDIYADDLDGPTRYPEIYDTN